MHGRTKSIRRCKNIEELLDDGGQICRGWHIIPLLQQLAVSAENENPKIERAGLCAKLGRQPAIEIRHSERVVSGISRNFLDVISPLKALRFFVEAMPHQHGRDPAHNPGVFLAEIQDRNHSVIRVA